MAKNIIDECKVYLPQFYVNGEFIESPSVKFNGKELSDEVKDFITCFYKFIFESDFLSEYTITWLKSNLSSIQKTFDFYNSQHDEEDKVNIKTAQSAIHYDKTKLKKYYDADMLFNVMAFPDKYLDEFKATLDILNRKYFNDKEYRDNLVLKLPNDIIRKEINDETFGKMLKSFKLYSKSKIRKIESLEDETVTKEMIGYYNYLISSKKLNEEDTRRLALIRRAIGI